MFSHDLGKSAAELVIVFICNLLAPDISYLFVLFYLALERVILPKSLIRMDGYVFSDCPAVSDVYYRGSESEFGRVQYGDGGNSLASAEMHYNYIEE